jgi:hypothetical protein
MRWWKRPSRVTFTKWVQPLQNAEDPIDGLETFSVAAPCLPCLKRCQVLSGIDKGFRRRTEGVFRDWHDAIAEALR